MKVCFIESYQVLGTHLLRRNSVQAQRSGEGGSDSDFERRLTALAERTPAQRKADAERVQQARNQEKNKKGLRVGS